MGVRYNLVAKNGTYKDKEGNEKTRWQKIGVVIDSSTGGMAAKIEMTPVGWDGWAQLAEPDLAPAKEPAKANAYQKSGADGLEDDIPFN
jgi:hypothetical protein